MLFLKIIFSSLDRPLGKNSIQTKMEQAEKPLLWVLLDPQKIWAKEKLVFFLPMPPFRRNAIFSSLNSSPGRDRYWILQNADSAGREKSPPSYLSWKKRVPQKSQPSYPCPLLCSREQSWGLIGGEGDCRHKKTKLTFPQAAVGRGRKRGIWEGGRATRETILTEEGRTSDFPSTSRRGSKNDSICRPHFSRNILREDGILPLFFFSFCLRTLPCQEQFVSFGGRARGEGTIRKSMKKDSWRVAGRPGHKPLFFISPSFPFWGFPRKGAERN